MPEAAHNSRIAALDGWRGIAILLVLEAHFWSPQHPGCGNWGDLGVTIFFVLSGYLITGNLLGESENGGIQLRRFYLRRVFRLWPCAWAYLIALVAIISIARQRLIWVDTWQCLLFVRNFSGHFNATGHFWTLSLEEQFYLVWPLALVICRRRAAWVAISGIVFVGIFRATHWQIWSDPVHPLLFAATQIQADGLLTGCLVAIFKMSCPRTLGNLKLLAVVILVLLPVATFQNYAAHTAEVFAIAAALLLTVQHPILNRVFSFRPLVKMGLISYSLYVWQGLFVSLGHSFHVWMTIPAILLAWASYEYIERPGIRLGARLMRSRERQAVPV